MTLVLAYVKRHHVALLALFVALGGTSYAAVKLPRSSVTSQTVKDRTLLAKDFKRGQLPRGATGARGATGLDGAQGGVGAQGAAGARGDRGAQGDTGAKGDAGAKGDTGTTGPVGPQYARATGSIGSGSVGFTPRTLAVTLPAAGRLVVTASIDSTASCSSAGACTLQPAVFVDGVAVTGAVGPARSAPANERVAFGFVTLSGVTAVLPAGSHVVTLEGRELTGDYLSASFPTASLQAVLAGPD